MNGKFVLWTFVIIVICSVPGKAQFEFVGLKGRTIKELKMHDNYLYASSDSGMYKSSLDDTLSWKSLGLKKEIVNDFVVFSHDTLLAGTYSKNSSDSVYIYRTVDGGETWTPYQNGFGAGGGTRFVRALTKYHQHQDSIYATGEIQIERSPDRGKSWQNVWGKNRFGLGTHFITHYPQNPSYMLAGGENAQFAPYVLISNDSGTNWEEHHEIQRQGDNAVYSGLFNPGDPKTFYIGMEGRIEKTVDGGNSWSIILEPETYPYFFNLDIPSVDPDFIYASGAMNNPSYQPLRIYWSKDGGNKWNFAESDTSWDIGGVKSMSVSYGEKARDNYVYLGTFEGGVFRYHHQISTRNEPIRKMPEKFELEKNYPNPFNPSTKIRFRLPQSQQVTINVYNTMGQKVKTLVNRQVTAGSHSVTFNSEGLPSGVYIYRLKAGEYRESRKMLLVK